jgi:hypothetical protein
MPCPETNICTATRQLAGPGLQPLEPQRNSCPTGYRSMNKLVWWGICCLLFFGPTAAGVVLVIIVGRKVLKRRFTTRAG